MATLSVPRHAPLAVDPRRLPELLRPAIQAAAGEAEAQRRLPAGLVATLREAGAFRLFTPVELGGFEADLATVLEVLEGFARIDGAVAWNVWNGNLGFAAGMVGDDGVAAIWGEGPDPIIANSARVTGTAVRDGDGFRLSGRWDIVSAIDIADWVALFAIVVGDEGPVMVAPGVVDLRAFFVRRDQIEVLDTWQVSGMRGTGSNSVVASSVAVPAGLAASPLGASHIDRPLYRIPAFTLASSGCAAAALGIAGAAIDAVMELAPHKATDDGQPLSMRNHAQAAVAGAQAELSAARLLLLAAAADVDRAAREAGSVGLAERGALRAAMSHAGGVCRRVVTAMYELGSSSSLYQGSRLDQAFRDGHAAAQHALLQPTHLATAGRIQLGLDPGVPIF